MGHRYERLSVMSIVCILLTLFCAATLAQNNPYKINDKLYPIYYRAYLNRNNDTGMLIADTLFREADKLKDRKAQCLALTIPVLRYYTLEKGLTREDVEKSINRIEGAVNNLKDFSRKTGYEQYYYFACNNFINYLLSAGCQQRALVYANDMYNKAKAHNSKLGIYSSLKTMGNIHHIRDEQNLAIKQYNEALAYGKENLQPKDYNELYYRLAVSHYYAGNYEESIKYAQLTISTTVHQLTRLRAMQICCMDYFHLGQYDKFSNLYDEITNGKGLKDDSSSSFTGYLDILHLIYTKDYDKAMALSSDFTYFKQRLIMQKLIYEHMGDYKTALETGRAYAKANDSINQSMSMKDMLYMTNIFEKNMLDEEQRAIELENANLELTHSNLELQAAKNAAENDKINSLNTLLALQNKDLEAKNLRALYDKQAMEQSRKNEESHSSHVLLSTTLYTSSAVVVVLAFVLMSRISVQNKLRRQHTQLQDNNRELTAARHEAEQANDMKTQFLHNMSHEVRTPLNAIVGFSQLIAESGDDLDDETKADFSNRIEENSELVLQIVNEILDITSIESGNYKMQQCDIAVNELCRKVLANFPDRVNPGVELNFTSDVDDTFTFIADARRLRQALINMVSNSAKYTDAGSITMEVSSTENPGYVSIAVADTGTGIPADKADVIFERFVKADSFKQGVGLGLSICRAIAEYQNGMIYLDKNYQKHGARFVIALPINQPNAPTSC